MPAFFALSEWLQPLRDILTDAKYFLGAKPLLGWSLNAGLKVCSTQMMSAAGSDLFVELGQAGSFFSRRPEAGVFIVLGETVNLFL